MTTTLLQLRDATYDILNDIGTSEVYPTSFVDLSLNIIERQVCRRAKSLKFLWTKTMFSAPVITTLSENAETTDVSLTVADTTNWDSAGALYINHDVINYTGKTSTTVTGVTNIDVDHDGGEVVYPLKAVPTNFMRMPMLFVKKSGSNRPIEFTKVEDFDFDNSPFTQRFAIVTDKNGVQYLRIASVQQYDIVIFHYMKKPTTMTLDADICAIPDDFALDVLPPLAAARCMQLRGDNVNSLADEQNRLGERALFEMLKYYGDREQGMRKMIQTEYRSGRTDMSSYNIQLP